MDKVKIRGAKLANCILAGSMVFVTMAAWGQVSIDDARIQRLKTNAQDVYAGSIKVGTGSCTTNIKNIKQTAEGLLLLVDRPAGCGFKTLELVVNGETLSLSALAGFLINPASGNYIWGNGITTGEMLFTSSQPFKAGIQTIALREPQCSDNVCLNSGTIELKTRSQADTSQPSSTQIVEITKGDPNKFSTTPGNPSCRFFDGFADNGDGTVTDPRNVLIWKRCAEGMTWDGSSCTGEGRAMNWVGAMQTAKQSRFLGKDDWRLPSKAELKSVVGSSTQGCIRNHFNKGAPAASGDIAWPIDSTKSLGIFWSSSPDVDDSGYGWSVSFNDGDVSYTNRYGNYEVRLVRASQSSGGEAALEFNREYAKMVEKEAKEAEEKRAEAKRRAYENSPEGRAEARRREAERAKYEANACSRHYVGKIVRVEMNWGTLDGEVRGVGNGRVTVRWWNPLSNDYGSSERPCSFYN